MYEFDSIIISLVLINEFRNIIHMKKNVFGISLFIKCYQQFLERKRNGKKISTNICRCIPINPLFTTYFAYQSLKQPHRFHNRCLLHQAAFAENANLGEINNSINKNTKSMGPITLYCGLCIVCNASSSILIK